MVKVSPEIPTIVINSPENSSIDIGTRKRSLRDKTDVSSTASASTADILKEFNSSRLRKRKGSKKKDEADGEKTGQADAENPEGSSDDDGDEESEKSVIHAHEYYHRRHRHRWWHNKDFLLLTAASCIGLTNIADFPAQVIRFGGLAYLIPYGTMLLTFTLPIIYLEMLLGQYVQQGVLGVWKLCPILKGLGITTMIAATCIPLWYVVEIAWCISFMVETLNLSPLAWNDCQGDWNTAQCIKIDDILRENETDGSIESSNSFSLAPVKASEEFYRHRILKEELIEGSRVSVYNLNNLGHNDRFLSLFVTLIYISIFFGLGFSHRIAGTMGWLSAFFPSACLSALIFRGVSLPGSFNGLDLVIASNFSKLRQLETWTQASVHAVESTGAGCGIHLTYASYNNFDRPVLRYAITTVLVDFGISLLSTILVFSYMGELSYRLQVPAKDISRLAEDDHIVFETVPEIIGKVGSHPPLVKPLYVKPEFTACQASLHFVGPLNKKMPVRSLPVKVTWIVAPNRTSPSHSYFCLSDSRIFLFLFFFTVMQLGIPKICACYECFITGIMDEYRSFFDRHKYGRLVLTFIAIVPPVLISLSCVSPGGIYIYLILKTGFNGPTIFIAGILFVLAIAGLVGTLAIRNALHAMEGHLKMFLYFEIAWSLLIFGHIIFALKDVADSVSTKGIPYWYETQLPISAFKLSVVFIYIPFLPVPIYGAYWLMRGPAPNLRLRWLLGISPEHEHELILKTGQALREKCIQCCCVSYFNRVRLTAVSSTKIVPVSDPKPSSTSTRPNLALPSQSELDTNSNVTTNESSLYPENEDPDLDQPTYQRPAYPSKSAEQQASDVQTTTKFISSKKDWPKMSLKSS